jgi:hypothetical protein
MNKKTLVAIAVVAVCALVTSVSAIITNSPLQKPTPQPTNTVSAPPSSLQTLSTPSSSDPASVPPPTSSSPSVLQPTPVSSQALSQTPSPTITPPPASPPTPEASSPFPQPAESPRATVANISNLFTADLSYVYVGPTNSTGAGHDHFGFNITTYPQNYYPAEIILKLTYTGNLGIQPYDAVFEGFLVTLSADTGTTASYVGYFGTNLNPSFSDLPHFPPSISGPRQSIYFGFNLTTDRVANLRMSDGGSFGSSPGSMGLWSNGTPNSVSVTVQRAGWVTVNGQSLTNVASPEDNVVIRQVQLEKSGSGFIFGTR